jgi:anti-sigma factor RsiW
MDGTEAADRRVIRHVDSCLRCQAELAQYRKLLRALHQLRVQQPEAPPGVVGEILATLERAGEKRAIRSALTGRRLAYLAGLGVAVGAAGAAGVVVVLTQRGRHRKVDLAR